MADGSAESAHPQTPLTNRGSVRAQDKVSDALSVHLDYLTTTVFTMDYERVCAAIGRVLEVFHVPVSWEELKDRGRWASVWRCAEACLEVRVPKLELGQVGYVSVSIPGKGCAAIGSAGLAGLLSMFSSSEWRWHCTRVDVAWDQCGFAPQDVHDAWKAGNVSTRLATVKESGGWQVNGDGRTAYVGDRKSVFFVRCYDKHGYTRFESELKDDWAKAFGEVLAANAPSEWGGRALEFVRRGVDFVDRTKSEYASRCPYLPWWAGFVGEAEKCKHVSWEAVREVEERTAYEELYDTVMRFRKKMSAAKQVMGLDYICLMLEEVSGEADVKALVEKWASARPAGRLKMEYKGRWWADYLEAERKEPEF